MPEAMRVRVWRGTEYHLPMVREERKRTKTLATGPGSNSVDLSQNLAAHRKEYKKPVTLRQKKKGGLVGVRAKTKGEINDLRPGILKREGWGRSRSK